VGEQWCEDRVPPFQELSSWKSLWKDLSSGKGERLDCYQSSPRRREPSCYQLGPWRGQLRERERESLGELRCGGT